MFDVGFAELLIIFVIALIVLGPERLPEAARAVGRWAGKARAFARNISNELDKEVRYSETARQVREARDAVKQQVDDFKSGATDGAADKPDTKDAGDAEETPPDVLEDQRIEAANRRLDAQTEAQTADPDPPTDPQESDHGTPAPQARPAAAPDKRDG